jgi:hypothetical protein
VDTVGQVVTFDPQVSAPVRPRVIDANLQLDAIACRTPTDCVAVDAAGRALEGDPRGTEQWSVKSLAAAGSLAAVVCPTALMCVAVDAAGDVFTGAGGPLPPIPSALSRPAIVGNPTQGRTLTELHGRWSNAPTSYAYQWQRCDQRGRACSAIAGATDPTYMPGQDDVGHRLRVLEAAANIAGAGADWASSTTLIVRPAVAVSASGQLLSLSSPTRPTLGLTLQAGPREPALSAITIRFPGVLHLVGGSPELATLARGITVKVRGRTAAVSTHMTAHALTIVLRRPASKARITLGGGVIVASGKLLRLSAHHRLVGISLSIVALEAGGLRTRLPVSVPVR